MATIYCDLDGVLANFVDGAIEAAGLPIVHNDVNQWDFFKPFMTAEDFWGRIHAQSCFWEDLPVYPWAHELVRALWDFGEVVFCTDPTLDDESATGKVKWLKRHGFVEPNGKNYVLMAEKWRLAADHSYLVDDSHKNCADFARAGNGTLNVFPQRWNTFWAVDLADPVNAVVSRFLDIQCLRGGAL